MNAPCFTRLRIRVAIRVHTSRCRIISSAKSRHFAKAPTAASIEMRDDTFLHNSSNRVCSEAKSRHARKHRVAEPCISFAAIARSLSRSFDAFDALSDHFPNAA